MKKVLTISVAILLACVFVFAGSNSAEAMNNESAALLAGAIAIFGKPVLNAIVGEVYPPQPAYSQAYYTVPYRTPYPAMGHRASYKKRWRDCREYRDPYKRGWCDEYERMEYRRGRMDAQRDFRVYEDDYRR